MVNSLVKGRSEKTMAPLSRRKIMAIIKIMNETRARRERRLSASWTAQLSSAQPSPGSAQRRPMQTQKWTCEERMNEGLRHAHSALLGTCSPTQVLPACRPRHLTLWLARQRAGLAATDFGSVLYFGKASDKRTQAKLLRRWRPASCIDHKCT